MNNPKQNRGRHRNNARRSNPSRQNFDSNGPGVRIRGSATQVYEKYIQLARDAQTSGDPVTAETMLQHAEHYYRLLNEGQSRQQQNNNGQSADQSSSQSDDNSSSVDGSTNPSEPEQAAEIQRTDGAAMASGDAGDIDGNSDGNSDSRGKSNGGRGRGRRPAGGAAPRGNGRGRRSAQSSDGNSAANSGAGDDASDGAIVTSTTPPPAQAELAIAED